MSNSRQDVRLMLKTADQLARNGLIAETVRCYDQAAEIYAASNQMLKAVAVCKQILTLVDSHHPELRSDYKHVWLRLADANERLGLLVDANEAYDSDALGSQLRAPPVEGQRPPPQQATRSTSR